MFNCKILLFLIFILQLFGEVLAIEEVPTIDLMCIFEKNAQKFSKDSGFTTTKDFAIKQVDDCNKVLKDSNITEFVFRLVHCENLDYVTQGDYSKDMNALRLGTYGLAYINKNLRDIYGADIVIMLSDNGQTNGLFGLMDGSLYWNTALEKHVPSMVISAYGANTSATMIHELGHALGAGHARDQNDAPGPQFYTSWKTAADSSSWAPLDKNEDYSSGYYFTADNVRYVTLMGYVQRGDSHTWTRVPLFSSPNLTYNNVPIGTKINDNVKIIKENWSKIANLKESRKTYGLDIENGDGAGNYPVNAPIELVAKSPKSGDFFAGWVTTGTGSFSDNFSTKTIYTMGEEDTKVTAVFKEKVGAILEIEQTDVQLPALATSHIFEIKNIGNIAFDYVISSNESWISSIEPKTAEIAANSSQKIVITVTNFDTIGTRTGFFTVNSETAECAPRIVKLSQEGAVLNFNYAVDNDNLTFTTNSGPTFSISSNKIIPNTVNSHYITSGSNNSWVETEISTGGLLTFNWATWLSQADAGNFIFEIKKEGESNYTQISSLSLAGTAIDNNGFTPFTHRIDKEISENIYCRWRISANQGKSIWGYLDNIRFKRDIKSVILVSENASNITVNNLGGYIDFELYNDGNTELSLTLSVEKDWEIIFTPSEIKNFMPGTSKTVKMFCPENTSENIRENTIYAEFLGGSGIFQFSQYGKPSQNFLEATPENIQEILEIAKTREVKAILVKSGTYSGELILEPLIKTLIIGEDNAILENVLIKSSCVLARLILKNIEFSITGVELERCSFIGGILTNPEKFTAKSTLFWQTRNVGDISNKKNCASESFGGEVGEIDENGNIKLDENNDGIFGPKLDINNKPQKGSILINRGK